MIKKKHLNSNGIVYPYNDIMTRSVSEAKRAIDEAYTNASIHKSIVVCHDDIFRANLHDILKEDDYPVCSLTNVISFVKDETRMLLIDFTDLVHVESFLPKKVLKQINYVFLIENERRREGGFKWQYFNFAPGHKVINV